MQKKVLDNFLQDIGNIREYIKHIELINEISLEYKNSSEKILNTFNNHLQKFRTEKKLFEYKAIIISLYGVLEKYVGIWIKEHIDNIPMIIQNYTKLPSKLQDEHFNLSIKLISIINEGRYSKYEHLQKKDLLTKLSSCINEPLNFEFNSDVFSPMSGNLKHSKIVEAFKPLDINLEEELNKKLDSLRATMLFNKINDLVTRRNDIAHGSKIDEILGITEFDEYIESLENYGTKLFEVLVEKEIEYESIHLYEKIEIINNVFRKKILDCDIKNSRIKKGDFIIVKNSNNQFFKRKILDIHLHEQSCNELIVIDRANIGIKLDNDVNENQTFYIKSFKNRKEKNFYYLFII